MFLSTGVLLYQMWKLGKQGSVLQAQECTQLVVNTSVDAPFKGQGREGVAACRQCPVICIDAV